MFKENRNKIAYYLGYLTGILIILGITSFCIYGSLIATGKLIVNYYNDFTLLRVLGLNIITFGIVFLLLLYIISIKFKLNKLEKEFKK